MYPGRAANDFSWLDVTAGRNAFWSNPLATEAVTGAKVMAVSRWRSGA
jgi:hypothetical protein